jgi:hypothetical protein
MEQLKAERGGKQVRRAFDPVPPITKSNGSVARLHAKFGNAAVSGHLERSLLAEKTPPAFEARSLPRGVEGTPEGPSKGEPKPTSPAKAKPEEKKAALSKVKNVTVTKHGSGFDDFETKRGGGKDLGYHFGWVGRAWYLNLRFLASVEVDGDINKCKYKQTIDMKSGGSELSRDDTYDELNARPLQTKEWVKVSDNTVIWEDAPGVTTESGRGKSALPHKVDVKFQQSASGEDGEEVKVGWNAQYGVDSEGKWTQKDDTLPVSKSHS